MGTIPELYNPVQEVARGLQEKVPQEFVATEEDRKALLHRPEAEEGERDIPVVDIQPLLDPNTPEEVRARIYGELGRAGEEWGFFQVTNHGIPNHMLDHLLETVEEFYDLPLEEKTVYSLKPGQTEGYGRFKREGVRPWNDCFRHVVHPRPAPEDDKSPATPAAYRELMKEYTGELVKLTRTLTSALSEYFGQEPSFLHKALSKELDDYPGIAVILNYQPPCPEPDRVVGVHAHSDSGCLTILYHNQVEGLQVLRDDKWYPVKPVKHALIINFGNQLEKMTNGRLISNKHRVVANKTKVRFSIASFCNPGPGVPIGVLPQFIDEKHPALYETSMDYKSFVTDYIKVASFLHAPALVVPIGALPQFVDEKHPALNEKIATKAF